uniref:CSD domain-containing protein n=1 Tax=Alexandrium catenella TaxID=2925 RepID=A0A7S1RHU0_ALECA
MGGMAGMAGMGMGGMGMSGMGMGAMGLSGVGMAGMANVGGMPMHGIGGMGTDQLLGEFLGIVRSINEEGGFGFIASDMLKAQGVTEDAYVHKHYLEGFSVGSEVSFTAFLDGRNGRPRAKDLKDAAGRVGQQATAGSANRGDQVVFGSYVGVIKSYNAIKGFGFITCQELKNEGHSGDVYLHQKHAQNSPFNVGDTVSFTAYLHAGRLQGRDLADPSAVNPAAKRARLDAGAAGGAAAGAHPADSGAARRSD